MNFTNCLFCRNLSMARGDGVFFLFEKDRKDGLSLRSFGI